MYVCMYKYTYTRGPEKERFRQRLEKDTSWARRRRRLFELWRIASTFDTKPSTLGLSFVPLAYGLQDFPRCSRGWEACNLIFIGHPKDFFTLSTLRLSRCWVRTDGNLLREAGCMFTLGMSCVPSKSGSTTGPMAIFDRIFALKVDLSSLKFGHTPGGTWRGCAQRRGGRCKRGGAGQGGEGRRGTAAGLSPRIYLSILLPREPRSNCPLDISSEARTNKILCKPNLGTQRAVDERFIRGTTAALRSWLLTSVPTPICLCKRCSCKAFPRKIIGTLRNGAERSKNLPTYEERHIFEKIAFIFEEPTLFEEAFHLRYSASKNEEPPTFDLRIRRTTKPHPSLSSIFGPENRNYIRSSALKIGPKIGRKVERG